MRINSTFLRFVNAPLFQKKVFWNIFFTLCFTMVCLRFSYDELLFERPHGIHVWRQTDCASQTLNYYQNNEPILEPSMHFRLNMEGKAVGEFPFFFYAVSILYKVFGFHEFVYRGFWLLIAFFGSFSFYRLCSEILGNPWLGIGIGLIPIISPIMAYYSISFISDPISVYLVFMFLYALFKSNKNNSVILFYLAILAAILSSLTKINGIVVPLIVLFISFVHFLMVEKEPRKLLHIFIGAGSIILSTLIWYIYAAKFNEEHSAFYFLLSAVPIWDLPMGEVKEIWDFILLNYIRDIYPPFFYYLTIFFFLVTLIKWKKNSSTLVFIILVGLAEVLYFLIFFPRFKYHDYYYIHFVPFFALTALLFFKAIGDNIKGKYLQSALFLLTVFAVVQNINYSVRKIDDKRNPPDMYGSMVDQGYYNLAGNLEKRGYFDLEPYLRELGIDRNDLVISIPDPSPNTTLYLMNQPGWSNLYHTPFSDRMIEMKKADGAKYLIVGHQSVLEQEDLQPYMKKLIGKHKEISIFEL
jgi:hypothetical protein